MSTKDIDLLKQELSSHIDVVISEKFKVIEKALKVQDRKINSIQNTVDVTEDELTQDRKDIGDLKIAQQGINTQFQEFRDMMGRQTETIIRKVTDSVEEKLHKVGEKMAEPVKDQVDKALTDFVSTDPKIDKRPSWWSIMKSKLKIWNS